MQPTALKQGYSTVSAQAPSSRQDLEVQGNGASYRPKQRHALIAEIKADLPRLKPKMRKLAEACLSNIHTLHRFRILELSGPTGNAPSTVVRFAKRYGYAGFNDFKLAFLQESLPDEVQTCSLTGHRKPADMHAALWELKVAASGAIALKDLVTTTSFWHAVQWTKAAGLIGILARSIDDRPIALHLELILKRQSRPTVVLTEAQYLQCGFNSAVEVLFDIDIGLSKRSVDYGKVLPTSKTRFVRIAASPSSAFSTNVMSNLGLFSDADFPEHLTLAAITLTNALCSSLADRGTDF